VAIQVAKKLLMELTASGNVPDSHRIPFSSPRHRRWGTIVAAKLKRKKKKCLIIFNNTHTIKLSINN